MNFILKISAVLFVVFGFLSQHAYTQTPVPDGLPAGQTATLKLRYSGVLQLKTEINTRVDRFMAKCSSVEEGSALEGQCVSEQAGIKAAKANYKDIADAYESDLKQAIRDATRVPDLAKDPALVEISRLRLEQIKGRLIRLQKAIDLLSGSNPSWAKQREILYREQIEATDELLWNGLDLMSAGMADLAKSASEAEFKVASAVLQGQDFSLLRQQKEGLMRLQKSFPNNKALGQWIDQLQRLQIAVWKKEDREVIAAFRDAFFYGREAYSEIKKDVRTKDEALKSLYKMTIDTAEFGMGFVEGVGAKAALPASAIFNLVEAGLRVKLVYEEEKQLSALTSQSADRNQKKRELMATKAELEGQARDLELVIQRSKGLK